MSFNFHYRLTISVLGEEGLFGDILKKVFNKFEWYALDEENYLGSQVIDECPFGIEHDSVEALPEHEKEGVIVWSTDCKNIFGDKVSRSTVKDNVELIDLWKVALIKDYGWQDICLTVISHPIILRPGEVCTERLVVLGSFKTEQEVVNFYKFMTTRFVRFLIGCSYYSSEVTARKFEFVPIMDFTREWTDEDLYEYFGIDACEQRFIETLVNSFYK